MLKMYAQRAELGGEVQTSLDIERPQSHVNDYDVVIEMLEISTADEILISQLQFRQYVRDEWSWKHDFIANSAFYKGGPVA